MQVKICGLKTAQSVRDAQEAGAAYLGFNFFAKSPRYVPFDQAARLTQEVRPGVCKVALCVNANDAFIDELLAHVPCDMLQLHGSESPERVVELKARTGLPVMKAIGIAEPDDLDQIPRFAAVVDQLLIDAKAPKGAALPGGNGIAFDWRLLSGRRWAVPWLLAGGLTPENAAEAARLTGATQLDVSSGVETSPGEKDAGLMRSFVTAASL